MISDKNDLYNYFKYKYKNRTNFDYYLIEIRKKPFTLNQYIEHRSKLFVDARLEYKKHRNLIWFKRWITPLSCHIQYNYLDVITDINKIKDSIWA